MHFSPPLFTSSLHALLSLPIGEGAKKPFGLQKRELAVSSEKKICFVHSYFQYSSSSIAVFSSLKLFNTNHDSTYWFLFLLSLSLSLSFSLSLSLFSSSSSAPFQSEGERGGRERERERERGREGGREPVLPGCNFFAHLPFLLRLIIRYVLILSTVPQQMSSIWKAFLLCPFFFYE